MQISREDKIRITEQLLATEGWRFIESELAKLIMEKDSQLDSDFGLQNTKRAYLNRGIMMGLRIAMNLPKQINADNHKFFDRLYAKMVGENHK